MNWASDMLGPVSRTLAPTIARPGKGTWKKLENSPRVLAAGPAPLP